MRQTTMLASGLTAAVTAVTLAVGSSAGATPPGPGVSGTIIAKRTIGDTDYTLREITIPPGQATGWHWHTGKLYGLVKQGTLSHFDATCESNGVYPTGTTIEEPSDEVHIGVNHGETAVVLRVLYVLPTGSPLSVDAPNPGCDFQ